mgnify:CR=1 FL=1
MPRSKRGVPAHKRHKKLLAMAEGQGGPRHRLFRPAREAVLRSLAYAYDDRRNRKHDMRRLWIARINAACRLNGYTYSRLIDGLNRAAISLDRKVLADMAVREPAAFAAIVDQARAEG